MDCTKCGKIFIKHDEYNRCDLCLEKYCDDCADNNFTEYKEQFEICKICQEDIKKD